MRRHLVGTAFCRHPGAHPPRHALDRLHPLRRCGPDRQQLGRTLYRRRPAGMKCPPASRLYALIVAIAVSGCASYWLLYPGMAESTDPHLDPAAAGHQYEVISVTNANRVSLKGWMFAKPGDR